MKKAMNKTRTAAIAFMVVFTMASAPSFAVIKDETPVEFKYIGSSNNQPLFQLNLHNADEGQFVITLKTSSGDVLYSEKISGKQLVRKYRLSTDEFDASGITVEVSSVKSNTKVVYAVNRKTRTVEDVVINRL